MPETTFARDEHLTTIAVAYKNPDRTLIADAVLPRVPVGKTTFSYFEYPLGEMYTVPDTRVGEHSRVPRVHVSGEKKSATAEDEGCEIPLTHRDIEEAPQGMDPRDRATERATNIVLMRRELRTAELVFNPASYPASQKAKLGTGGRKKWSEGGSTPLKDILDAIDACLVKPNVLLFGQKAWRAISTHPDIVKAITGADSGVGKVKREQVAELFEVTEVLVGESMVNIEKPGKTPQLSRLWGPHALAFYRDRTVDTSGGVTFGFTAQVGQRVAGTKRLDIGLHGGEGVVVGETLKELIVAPYAAYFIEDAA